MLNYIERCIKAGAYPYMGYNVIEVLILIVKLIYIDGLM